VLESKLVPGAVFFYLSLAENELKIAASHPKVELIFRYILF
jgi:hypothetical protein